MYAVDYNATTAHVVVPMVRGGRHVDPPAIVGGDWPADWQVGATTDGRSVSGLPDPGDRHRDQWRSLTRTELIEGKNGLVQAFCVDSVGRLKAVPHLKWAHRSTSSP